MDRKAIGRIVLLWSAGLVAGAQFAKFSVVIGDITKFYGVGDIYSSLLLSALGSMGILFGATIGVVVGRFSPVKLLAGALWCAGIISLLQPLLPRAEFLMFFRILESFTQIIIVTAAPMAMLLCVDHRYGSTVMAFWSSFFNVAFFLVTGVTPFLLSRWEWQSLFVTHGIFTLCIALGITIFAVRNRDLRVDTSQEDAFSWGVQSFFQQHREVYRRRGSVVPAILFLTYTITYLAFITYIPMLFESRYDSELRLLRMLMVGMPILSLVGTFFSGGVLRWSKVSPFITLIICYLVMIASILLIILVLGSSIFFVSIALLFITASGVLQATIFGLIPYLSNNPVTQSYANGGVVQMGNLGTTLGPPLFTMLLLYGWSSALFFPVLCYVFGLGVVFLVRRSW